jgi:hypothetical protein
MHVFAVNISEIDFKVGKDYRRYCLEELRMQWESKNEQD